MDLAKSRYFLKFFPLHTMWCGPDWRDEKESEQLKAQQKDSVWNEF